LQKILDAETIQAAEGIRARAEDIQRTLFLDRDYEQIDEKKFIEDIVGS
jgi:hypothetical protein